MKKATVILALALVLAALIGAMSQPMAVEERLVSVHARELLPEFDVLQEEPIEVQAAIVDLGDDPLVLLKAREALLVHPEMARVIFPLYGAEPEFQDVLRRYGEQALPPIDYFLREPVRSIEWMDSASRQYQRARNFVTELRGKNVRAADHVGPDDALTPEERGWYAVNFIRAEGHDFLGQFVVDTQGRTQWVQTERVVEGLAQFFTSGVRQLETNVRTGAEVSVSDIGWASVDVLVFASAVKLLRAGRAATTATRGAGMSTRSAALAARITGGGRLVLGSARYAKWPLVIGAGYLVLRHPDIISDVFAGIADVLGVPQWLAQIAGWVLILVPVLYVISWLLLPAIALLRALVFLLVWITGRQTGHSELR
ncbi:PspC domain-containing protein [Marinobacter sp.]|uniref:PspC domain-containing protein n=1 Tax=Marinobacter sp. TaxID=50741 RepID=UPI0034A5861F